MANGKSVQDLIDAGILPEGTANLPPPVEALIGSLTDADFEALVSISEGLKAQGYLGYLYIQRPDGVLFFL